MREKELRLALVFFGGVSLAVYMHGISKEILKLVRASAALHAIGDRTTRANAAAADYFDSKDPEYDTEPVYFDLLREIGRKLDLRVIVDIVAGASAGGINGVMLARALAHNLTFTKLRNLWLEDADVTQLLAAERKAKAWSKWFLMPLIWGIGKSGLLGPITDPEARRKLSLFVRSRWFRPPFDGPGMSALMLAGVRSMVKLGRGTTSLLPTGQTLELFVTVTDFYGYQKLIQIHDPPVIQEREHRHILRFSCQHWPSGAIESDFDLANAPSLAFAARATSAFPGAFPPARIDEMDRLLAGMQLPWPTRGRFLERNFRRYRQVGSDPEATAFIDGSVLNNKPFSEAIRSIRGRPAYREVDRRLVYVDPDPRQSAPPVAGRIPGFFSTLKAALSDIPRNEPIADELDWVVGFNERVRRLRAIVEAARPQISRLVLDVTPAATDRPFTAEEIRGWRESVNVRVAESAGFAYEGYVRLKLSSALGFIARVIADFCGIEERSIAARAIFETVSAWAQIDGIIYRSGEVQVPDRDAPAETGGLPPWVKFLLDFDVEFRRRRMSFLIQGQNRLYGLLDGALHDGKTADLLNQLKRKFYESLDALRHCERPEAFSPRAHELARRLFAEPPPPGEVRHIEAYARRFAERRIGELNELIACLAAGIDLKAATDDVDALLADMDAAAWEPRIRREVLVNYLGFPFWDVLTFSVTNWRDAGEFDEIRIDRISPEDSETFRGKEGLSELKGTDLGHFSAFFSRGYRENDYLLGRLNAVERLIDILVDSANLDPAEVGIDIAGLKSRAIKIVLDAEAPHLGRIGDFIARWRTDSTTG